MMNKWFVVARYFWPIDAYLARIHLELEGIQCTMPDEVLGSFFWHYNIAIGRIRLFVPESNFVRAQEILSEDAISTKEATLYSEKKEEAIFCPRCLSENVRYELFNRWIYLIILIFTQSPISYLKRKWHCRDCGKEWKE